MGQCDGLTCRWRADGSLFITWTRSILQPADRLHDGIRHFPVNLLHTLPIGDARRLLMLTKIKWLPKYYGHRERTRQLVLPSVGLPGSENSHRHDRRARFDHNQPDPRPRRLELSVRRTGSLREKHDAIPRQ